jgi:hypothetical protein
MKFSTRKGATLALSILVAAGLFFFTVAVVQGQGIEQPPTMSPPDQPGPHPLPDAPNPTELDYPTRQTVSSPQSPASTSTLAPVLLIMDRNPWGGTAIQDVLNEYRIPYNLVGSSDIPTIDLSPYPVVIIPSVQNTDYYSTYNANLAKFETYVANGGVLELHGASYSSDPPPLLPGGVTNHYDTDDDNYIEEPAHPLVSLVEDVVPNPFPGGSASHNYFSNTVTSTTIICTQGVVSGGNPTLIEYPYGDGLVIASGQTMEYYYVRQSGAGLILPNMILYAYSRATGLALLLPEQHWGGTPDSVVSYTLTLWNLTGITDSFDLTATGNVWPATFWDGSPITRTGILSNYHSADLSVQVSIPPGASPGDVDVADIHAASVTSPTVYSSTAAITTSAICAPNLVFSGQSEPITGNRDDVYDYGSQKFAQVYVYAHSEDNDDLDAIVSGYDPGSDTWQVIGQQSNGSNGIVANHYPFPPTYTAVRVQLDDTDNDDLVWYDYHFAVCREPAVGISPLSQESLTQPGATVFYTQTVSNYTMGSDTFDLTTSGNSWTVTLWSGGVQVSDTGTLADQEIFTVTAQIEAPASASAGDTDEFTIQAQSTTSPAISDTTSLRTSVIAYQWVQAFSDEWSPNETNDRDQYLDIVGMGNIAAAQMTDDSLWQDGPPAVAAYPQYGIVAAWVGPYHNNGSTTYYDVEYAAFDLDGDPVIPVTQVSDNVSATVYTREYNPVLAVDPVDGTVLAAWYRYAGAYNVYYAVRSVGGSGIISPTALTTNTTSSFEDSYASAAAFGSGGFVVAWQHYDSVKNGQDIHYTVISSTGEVITGPIQLTDNTGENDYPPRANRLADGNVMLTWRGNHGSGHEIYYAVVNSAGNVVHPVTRLTDVSNSAYEPDAVGLQNGNTIVAWRQRGNYPTDGYQIAYAVLDSAYTATIPITMPTIITNTLSNDNYYVSLARDSDDNAVLTWSDDGKWRIYYALVDNTGTVRTWPMILRTARGGELDVNEFGRGNGSFPAVQLSRIYLPIVLRNQ